VQKNQFEKSQKSYSRFHAPCTCRLVFWTRRNDEKKRADVDGDVHAGSAGRRGFAVAVFFPLEHRSFSMTNSQENQRREGQGQQNERREGQGQQNEQRQGQSQQNERNNNERR
jgi:hypothetical protein